MNERSAFQWPHIHVIGDVIVQSGFVLGPRSIGDFELVYFPEGTNTVYSFDNTSIVLNDLFRSLLLLDFGK